MGKDIVQVSFEVQVLQGGNWRIHAQFSEDERDDAIEEAKILESMPGVGDIKVIRDAFDTDTHLHKEHIIYKYNNPNAPAATSDAERFARVASGGSRGGGSIPEFEDEGVFGSNGGGKSKSGKSSSGVGVLVKLLLVILFGLAMAALVTGLVEGLMPYKKIMGIAFYGKMRANVLFIVFAVFFVLTVGSSFKVFMSRDKLDAPKMTLRPRRSKRHAAKNNLKPGKQEKKEKPTKKELSAREERKKREQERKDKEDALTKEKEKEKKEDLLKAAEELKNETEEAIKRKAEQDAAEQEEEPAEEEPMEEFMSANAEQQKLVMMSFFGESIRSLPMERKKMDNYNRFGVNLYLAGASEAIGSERGLESEETEKMLSDSLKVMGMPENNADAFSRRYEEYLLSDARYMQMFQSGRRDMSAYLDGEGDEAIRLDETLGEWNKPKEPDNPEKQIVVMFTDIVGSTAMTQEKGNLGAQEIIRAHNKVVRESLAQFRGKEIKHTGDGIMASFEDVSDSINSTAHMQRLIQIHNQNDPTTPLRVKIGTAMGSVVVEESDLYGVTVQMAARIVDKASEGMNLVSDTVYGMLKGGTMQFVKRGPYLMKGIDGPAYLYEHIWNDKADVAAMKAQAETDNAALAQQAGIVPVQAAPQELPQ